MKFRIRLSIVGASIIALGLVIGAGYARQALTPSPIASAHLPPAKAALPSMAVPVELIVPRLHLRAPIEQVGLTSERDMAAPSTETQIGWYNGGAYPGNPGPAVLAGHTGRPDAPSIFKQLQLLNVGEQLTITDARGTSATFRIAEISTYTPASAPRERIFGPTDSARLVLITCTGEWLPDQTTYSHRHVIYAFRIS